MECIPLERVKIGANRQRRKFDPKKIQELAQSILKSGLLHPIGLSDANNRFLVHGERRLRAITTLTEPYMCNGVLIKPGWIPVTYSPQLSETDRYEAELAENVHRIDLDWKERIDSIARLHFLRHDQAALAGEKQTFTATAKEVHGDDYTAVDVTGVRDATVLQPLLADPDVAAAKNVVEAMAIARRKLTQTFTQALAKNFDVTKAPSEHMIICGDAKTELKALPNATFDVIITDPPYGINAHLMAPMSGSQSGVSHEYIDTPENAYAIWHAIFVEGARVCKPEAHLYMFCDFRHWQPIVECAQREGWTPWPTPIVWHKPGGGNLGDSSRGPRKSYELIFYAHDHYFGVEWAGGLAFH